MSPVTFQKIRAKKSVILVIIPMLACLFNVFLVVYPRDVLNAARQGLNLWFNSVLPSLLPFMMGVNMLRYTGFIYFIGGLLSPVMRPLFNVPGAGGFAFITGLTSGYPLGAKTVAELRADGRITPAEAQRLAGFCNNAGPLFLLGVVGAGLFGRESAGYCLWASNVLAALCVGMLMRFYKNGAESPATYYGRKEGPVLRRAFEDFRCYRLENDASFPKALGDSVKNAMESITIVGGFIILFCVLSQIMETTGAFSLLTFGRSENNPLIKGILSGLLEVTTGAQHLARAQNTSGTAVSLITASALVSFGGFSIHAQSLYFIKKAGIKTAPYLLCKGAGAVLAAVFCAFLLGRV